MRAAIGVLLLASCAAAQNWQPNITNARIETRAFAGDLAAQLHASTPTWFGYAVKSSRMDDGGDCHSRLEGGWENRGEKNESGPVHLEASTAAVVLFRVTGNEIQKVQAHPLYCQLEAGGMPFVWLTGVPSGTSIEFLQKLVGSNDTLEGALLAISMHDDPRADTVMEKLTRSDQPEKVREKAVFWLGVNRSARGVEVLGSLLKNDPSEHIRDKAVFGLFVSKQPEALALLISAAKNDPSGHVRGQALFWLAQKAGQRASAMIVDAIRDDPDTEVKKRAVFALSQLPKDEGVPRLIEVAQTQKNAEVRKQAFFWLGQSQDPRAVRFITHVLTGD
jgi:HEAT repeat protein